jgi:hypothetical protein
VPQYLLDHFNLDLCLVQAGGKPPSKSMPAVPFPFFDYGCHLSADQIGEVKWCSSALAREDESIRVVRNTLAMLVQYYP